MPHLGQTAAYDVGDLADGGALGRKSVTGLGCASSVVVALDGAVASCLTTGMRKPQPGHFSCLTITIAGGVTFLPHLGQTSFICLRVRAVSANWPEGFAVHWVQLRGHTPADSRPKRRND